MAALVRQDAVGCSVAAFERAYNAEHFFAKVGAIIGGGFGMAVSGGCDYVSVGACVPANPGITVGGIAVGAAIGAQFDSMLQNAAPEDKPSLLDPKGEKHVLDGDATGGGHRPGTGKPGKSEFPSHWSDDRIKGEISDVATDPNSTTTPGRGGRSVVKGTRDGIDITVVVEPGSKGGRIVTGFPTNVPRNP